MKPPKSAKRPPKADPENWKARCLDAEGKLAALRRGKDLVEIDLTKVLENSLTGEMYRRIDELERQLAGARNLENSLARELYQRIDELERQLAGARNEAAQWQKVAEAKLAASQARA